jgi:hypothetical protein
MTDLKPIFNAFDVYEEAVSDEVEYKIKMRNDKRKVGNAMGNKDFRVIINKMKAKEALFDKIREFMAQNKQAQNKMMQSKTTQNKMMQNKMAQSKTTQNKMAQNKNKPKNKTRRSTLL